MANGDGGDFYATRRTAAHKIADKLKILHWRQEAHEHDRSKPLFGSKEPFAVGRVERRMKQFAQENGIELATSSLYMSEERLLHSIRSTKQKVGKVVSDKDIANFPAHRYKMNLYWDSNAKNFIYQQGNNKFIVEPNREIKLSNGKVKRVMIVTIDRMKGTSHFNEPKYIKIK